MIHHLQVLYVTCLILTVNGYQLIFNYFFVFVVICFVIKPWCNQCKQWAFRITGNLILFNLNPGPSYHEEIKQNKIKHGKQYINICYILSIFSR